MKELHRFRTLGPAALAMAALFAAGCAAAVPAATPSATCARAAASPRILGLVPADHVAVEEAIETTPVGRGAMANVGCLDALLGRDMAATRALAPHTVSSPSLRPAARPGQDYMPIALEMPR